MECVELEELEDSMHGNMFKTKYVYSKDEANDSWAISQPGVYLKQT